MSKTLVLSGALILSASSLLPAQTVRWNDRSTTAWQDQAPRVKLSIEGDRGVGYGAPVRIKFEVSDNAYVTVVRVDDDGRMSILYPYSRSQRAAVRGDQVYYVRNPRLGGEVAFVANDRFGGYVFAIASYQPLDFSGFENRDYERIGGYSQFTVANRSIARRPDVFIDRFAARVLWSVDTPYDYDVDYYHAFGYPSAYTHMALCGFNTYSRYYGIGTGLGYGHNFLSQLSSWDRMNYPYSSYCRNLFYDLYCLSSFVNSYMGCSGFLLGRGSQIANGGQTGGGGSIPVDSSAIPNEGVIRGGLFTPNPVPIPVDGFGPDAPPVERVAGRFDQIRADELEGIASIPVRATRKMKEDDARRERGVADPSSTTARTGFDRVTETNKPGKTTADANSAPTRQPTKTKSVAEPRRETTSNGGFNTTSRPSTREPRSNTPDRDMGSRPVKPASAPANPPSVQGTSTSDKKKPPQE